MNYSHQTITILICMILTGSFRTVAVKLLYQIGLQSPYLVTLLYLCGQSLSLVVHCAGQRLGCCVQQNDDNHDDGNHPTSASSVVSTSSSTRQSPRRKRRKDYTAVESIDAFEDEDFGGDEHQSIEMGVVSSDGKGGVPDKGRGEKSDDNTALTSSQDSLVESVSDSNKQEGISDAFEDNPQSSAATATSTYTGRPRSGSETGLTPESSAAVSYIHSIPTALKPAMPGLCNLINSAMRWGCLVYVPASTAEMLISGLELILSTVAARMIRKRLISKQRWGGVLIVAVGLAVVRLSNISPDDDADDVGDGDVDNGITTKSTSPWSERVIGDVLIVGQCIMSVLQDMAEELFMHESNLSPTLLLGWEGIFGLSFGLPLYFPLGPLVGEDPLEAWSAIRSSSFTLAYVIVLVLLFTATGILNILATSVTSSMTRNVWKNFRSAVVWIMGLIIYYSSGNINLGEEWRVPASFVTLVGYAIMICGVCLYYQTSGGNWIAKGGCCYCLCRVGMIWGYSKLGVVEVDESVVPRMELPKVPSDIEEQEHEAKLNGQTIS